MRAFAAAPRHRAAFMRAQGNPLLRWSGERPLRSAPDKGLLARGKNYKPAEQQRLKWTEDYSQEAVGKVSRRRKA